MQKESLKVLNDFVGYKTELSLVNPNITFMYYNFNWDIDEQNLILFDSNEEESKVYLPLFKINNIKDLSTKRMFDNVISVYLKDCILHITCCDDYISRFIGRVH